MICTCHVHPPPLPLSSFLVPFLLCPSQHTYAHTEAVVLFDYEKQEDDELSLKVGGIITDVKQVCAACCTIMCMHTS